MRKSSRPAKKSNVSSAENAAKTGYTRILMFARKLRVEMEEAGGRRPCPLEWLDRFFMRHFTGISALDNTLPVAEGCLEAGLDVNLDVLRSQFAQWLRGHKLLASTAELRVMSGGCHLSPVAHHRFENM